MASFLNKVKIPTALDERTKLDLGCDHITTSNWFQYNVAYNKEMVPTEKLSVNMQAFTRLLPLTRPTFGRANMNNRAFFVPYRTIMPSWNEFITDTTRQPYVSSASTGSNTTIPSTVPYFTNGGLITLFTSSTYGMSVVGSAASYDFVTYTNSTTSTYYRFTDKGRQAYKILLSLGYDIIWDTTLTSGFSMSALPLLAVAKIYFDWYVPQQYENYGVYANLQKLFKIDASTGGALIQDSQLNDIFIVINWVSYDADYFTSAWDNPVSPNAGNYSSIQITDTTMLATNSTTPSGNSSQVTTGASTLSSGTPAITDYNAPNAGSKPISQYIITALKSVNDYLKRHQLAGAKVLDRYLSRFGVKLEDEKIDRSLYLGQYKVPIQIGDVMSTSDSDSNSNWNRVGDYAGKGVGYGDGNFDFNTDEYGQFIIISTIIPAAGYFRGIDRNVRHINKLDFYTPEFDNLGVQPINSSEVYTSVDPVNNTAARSGLQSAIFGFAPRYAEYKFGRDRLTGNFRVRTLNNQYAENAWHLMRDTNLDFGGNVTVAGVNHSVGFVAPGWRVLNGGTNDADLLQYNRIFQTTNSDEDKFNIIYHFEVASWSPMKPLYDTYEFDDNGKNIVNEINGVKAN